jgi:hypothetical protein
LYCELFSLNSAVFGLGVFTNAAYPDVSGAIGKALNDFLSKERAPLPIAAS